MASQGMMLDSVVLMGLLDFLLFSSSKFKVSSASRRRRRRRDERLAW